ncbi:hypothetical protein PspCFBP13528_14310 [Pseudomonas sp. CFBP13528]|nr:hypothetical protein PspCFBP13528_14310 [Pseudomonas sp. CFBP13528]
MVPFNLLTGVINEANLHINRWFVLTLNLETKQHDSRNTGAILTNAPHLGKEVQGGLFHIGTPSLLKWCMGYKRQHGVGCSLSLPAADDPQASATRVRAEAGARVV